MLVVVVAWYKTAATAGFLLVGERAIAQGHMVWVVIERLQYMGDVSLADWMLHQELPAPGC